MCHASGLGSLAPATSASVDILTAALCLVYLPQGWKERSVCGEEDTEVAAGLCPETVPSGVVCDRGSPVPETDQFGVLRSWRLEYPFLDLLC